MREGQPIVADEQRRHLVSARRFVNERLIVKRDGGRGNHPLDDKPGDLSVRQLSRPIEFARPKRALAVELALPGMTQTDGVHGRAM